MSWKRATTKLPACHPFVTPIDVLTQMANQLNQRQQKTLGALYGQHRSAASPAQGNPAQASGGPDAGADDTFTVAKLQAAVRALGAALDEPGPIEDAGIRAGEIRAWRAWLVQGEGLFSTYMEDIHWPPGQPMTGDVSKHYGVHAFKTLPDAFQYVQHIGVCFSRMVVGEVDLWGDVVEHEHGYRAEFAQIVSLLCDFPEDRRSRYSVHRLREVYFGGREPVPVFYHHHAKVIKEWLAGVEFGRSGRHLRIAPKVFLSCYPIDEKTMFVEPPRVVTLFAERRGREFVAVPADEESRRLIAEWRP